MVDWPTELGIDPDDWDTMSKADQLYELWDADIFSRRFEEWPITDLAGNEYPIDWFEIDDIDTSGQMNDGHGCQYSPFAGNLEPIEDRCNARLTRWQERYPEKRFCSFNPTSDSTYCRIHQDREALMKSAEEVMQTGLGSKTIDHHFNKLDDPEQLLVHGIHEDLLAESSYEFAPEHRVKEFDFSGVDYDLPVEEDGPVYEIECVYATGHVKRSLALFTAAVMEAARLEVVSIIKAETMRSKTTSQAQLTSPTEADPSQEFKTIEEWNEHYLNLPLSRLVRDQKELLKEGGVTVDGETNSGSGGNPLVDRLQHVDDDLTESDPELIQQGAETREQVEAADADVTIEEVDDDD